MLRNISSLLLALALVTITTVQSKVFAQTLAQDNFSSLNGSGGTGWANSWNAGNFSAGDLQFTSNNSQTVSRNFNGLTFTPRPSQNADGAAAGFYSIQYAIGFNINPSVAGNYGFRMYQGGNNAGGTFVGVWKNDYNDGRLTFVGTNGTNNAIAPTFATDAQNNSYDIWDIDNAQNSRANGVTYLFTYDVSVLHGQNPNQYRGGSYNVQVVRYVNGTLTHTAQLNNIGWRDGNNINPDGILNNITFQNTNNKTNVFVDDVMVSRSSLMVAPVPEPSSGLLVLATLCGAVMIRRRPRR